MVPVVRLPLSDLIGSESLRMPREEAGFPRVFRSRSSDTEQHSSQQSLHVSSSVPLEVNWKSTLPAVPSWTPLSSMTSPKSAPTLDSKSAQFAVSAIDGYAAGIGAAMSAGEDKVEKSIPLVSNGPEVGRVNPFHDKI